MDPFQSTLFIAYAKCVVVLGLKMTLTAWTTVYHMIASGGNGIRNPEDLLQGPCNPHPHPDQLQPYEPAEKQRRIMGHDLENNVPFFAVGLIYALMNGGGGGGADGGGGDGGDPATILYAYTASKIVHHAVYWAGLRHEVRAAVWTVTNGCFLYLSYLTWKGLG